jgi:hypothetical protein
MKLKNIFFVFMMLSISILSYGSDTDIVNDQEIRKRWEINSNKPCCFRQEEQQFCVGLGCCCLGSLECCSDFVQGDSENKNELISFMLISTGKILCSQAISDIVRRQNYLSSLESGKMK